MLFGSGLIVNLVHNPGEADLPGPQACLEYQYRQTLKEKQGVDFNQLFCITNMPIGRYLQYLQNTGNYEGYMHALVEYGKCPGISLPVFGMYSAT